MTDNKDMKDEKLVNNLRTSHQLGETQPKNGGLTELCGCNSSHLIMVNLRYLGTGF